MSLSKAKENYEYIQFTPSSDSQQGQIPWNATPADTEEALRKFYESKPRPFHTLTNRNREFPIDAFTPTLLDAAWAIEDKVRCPRALACTSVLAAASLAAQAHGNIILPYGNGKPEPLSLYILSIAESGERKSSADAEALRPVREREAELRTDYEQQMRAYTARAQAWEAQVLHIRREKNTTFAEKEKQIFALGMKPVAPPRPVLTCQEPTIEGLKNLFCYGHPSLGLFSAEGGSFIGGHGLSEDARIRTVTALSNFWDGVTVDHTRSAGNESYTLVGKRLSLHLMVQPLIASEFLSLKQLQSQGIFSRILISHPDSIIGDRPFAETSAGTEEMLARYTHKLLKLFKTTFRTAQNRVNELDPWPLTFDKDAKELWVEYYNEVEEHQKPNGKYRPITGFASKLYSRA